MKGKIARLTIVSIVAMLLVGMLSVFANPYAPPPDMYLLPEVSTFNTAATPVGFKFNVTVWLNMDVSIFTWQAKITYNSAWLNCTRAVYAGPLGVEATKSEYFTGFSTVPVDPVLAVGSVLHGESLSGAAQAPVADKRLFKFELQIIAAPNKYETLTSALHFDAADTFVLDPDLGNLAVDKHDGSVSYVWSAPASPFMGFDPFGTVMVSDRYDDDWNMTTFAKEVSVKQLDAAWHLSSASFKVNYNIGDPFLGVVSITPDPLWGSVVIDTSVPNVIGVTASNPSVNPSGDVLVITIVFNLVYKDDFTVDPLDECDMTFSNVVLMDTIAEIPTRPPQTEHDLNEGLLVLPLPYLAVVPETTILGPEPVAGETFDVAVEIRSLHSKWYLIGVQFRLAYDAGVVEPVAVTEGPYLPYYAALQPGSLGTFFIDFFEPGPPNGPHVLVGDLILPNSTGWWNPPFPGVDEEPYGSGVIAIITFRVIKQIYPINITGEFNFIETLFVDQNSNEIPHDDEVDGQVIIAGSPLPGRMIDLYTQYPAPFGGQGQDNPSDMFWPQKEIVLIAFVTYNWWPMQQKLVGFEIKDPQGNTWAKLSDVTDVDGIASVSIRLPWPCDDPESLFGVWHVIATVDIACIVVDDTLDFHYDYLARLFKVTITPPACGNDLNFAHCDDVVITVEYGTYAMQTYHAVIAYVLSDEVNVPIGIDLVELTIGGATYCSYKKGTVTLSIHIPKFAVAGVGTLHVNIFDFDPFDGGIPLCPEFSPAPTIFITPY